MNDLDPHPRPRAYLWASALFIVGALALAAPWLLGIVTIPWDAKAQAWPQFAFLARSFAAGDNPLWTPNIFAGHPQIADPQSLIFSPPFLLAAWLDPRPSFVVADAIVFAMLVLGGLALMQFFRDRGWRAEGALVAAFAFSFGCSNAWRLQHVGEVVSCCWFAIALCFLARALQRSSPIDGALAGIVAGFMALGRDQIALLCAYALATYTIWTLVAERGVGPRLRAAAAPLAAAFVAGALVTMVPILLSLALADDSNRPAIDFAGAGRGSLPPLSFLTIVVANLFGVDGPNEAYWGPPAAQVWGPTDLDLARNMATLYFGALPLVAIACLGVARGALRARGVAVFSAAAAGLALFAVGRYTPLFTAAFHLPGVDLYRRPADATFPLGATLALVAGFCVHCAAGRRDRLGPLGPLIVAGLFALCVFVAVDRGRLAQATPALLTGALFLALALILLAVLPRWSARRPGLALVAIAVLMTLDLAVNNKPNESTALPPGAFDALAFDGGNETIRIIETRLAATAAPDRRDRVELAGLGFEWPNAGLVHGFDNDLGYNPLRLKLFYDVTHAPDQVAEMGQRVFSPLFPSYKSPMADLLGLRLIVTGAPPQTIDPALKPGDLAYVARTRDGFVWENPRALPRVLVPARAVAADFGALIADGGMPGIDYRANVLLEHPDPADIARAAEAGTARIVDYRHSDIVIEANAPHGGYVVLDDVWQAWWRAQVDGAPAPILRANVMFRAVKIPPGAHEVRFTFRPFAGLWRQWIGGAAAAD